MNQDFSRDRLIPILAREGIKYVFLGKELGARTSDPDCYDKGKVVYSRLSSTNSFIDGLQRVENGSKQFRIALMCAEREPLSCHRCILVSRHLVERGSVVTHILGDGSFESHKESMGRLINLLGLTSPHMFRGPEETMQLAYEKQEDLIAYQQEEQEIPAFMGR